MNETIQKRLKKGLELLRELFNKGFRCEYYVDDESKFEDPHYMNCKICQIPKYKGNRFCEYMRHFLGLCGEM